MLSNLSWADIVEAEIQLEIKESTSKPKPKRNRFRKKKAGPMVLEFTDGTKRVLDGKERDLQESESIENLMSQIQHELYRIDQETILKKFSNISKAETWPLQSNNQENLGMQVKYSSTI